MSDSPPVPSTEPWPPARRPWSAWSEARADLRAALVVIGALAVAGLPAGLLWWWLAPRADFRITADGPVAIGRPSSELLVADDAVFALVLAGLGVLAGAIVWRLRRRRGVAMLFALGLGAAAAAVVAWRLGMVLGPGPTEAELAHVGGVVTTSLRLGSLPALAVGSFTAVLAYVVAVLATHNDDLGRGEQAGEEMPPAAEPVPETVPSAGPPS